MSCGTSVGSMVPEPRGYILKRTIDLGVAGLGLIFLSPILAVFALLVWMQDGASPLYVAPRVGRDARPFRMVKLRSMVVHADRTGVDSTASGDSRVTPLGRIIRRFKLDELMQLWNVVRGDMSLVGPRPQVPRDVALYTAEERGLLSVRPGITDFASIVFADEGEILAGADDPDLRYQQIIRPWKSRMGLQYVAARTLWLDVRLVLATALNVVSRRRALGWVANLLARSGADTTVVTVARRRAPLEPAPPPGETEVVMSRAATRAEVV